jgi:hypothetical protein
VTFFAIWASAGAVPALAQNDKPVVFLSYAPITPDKITAKDHALTNDQGISLRPNVTQSTYFFVKNYENLPQTMVVQLLRPQGAAPALEFASAEVEVEAQETKAITLWQLAGAAPAPAAPAPPAAGAPAVPAPPPAPLPELKGSPFSLRVRVFAKAADKLKPLADLSVPVTIQQPREYVKSTGTPTFQDNQLKVTLQADDRFSGPPCPVVLVLDPSRIPGLLTAQPVGVFAQKLIQAGQKAVLSADNLKFTAESHDAGTFSISVDDCERVFIYSSNFGSGGTVTTKAVETPELRIVTKGSYIPPGDKIAVPAADKLAVRLEVDNVEPKGSALKLGLFRQGEKDPVVAWESQGAVREQHVKLPPPAKDGALLFQTEMHDWTVELDTAKITGTYLLHASVTGTSISGSKLDRPIEKELKIILDPTPPVDVTIVKPASGGQVVRGLPINLAASGEDNESGIAEVQFFIGKPTPDHKAPPMAFVVKGTLVKNSSPPTYTASLNLPPDVKGVVDLGVVFTNGAGQSKSATVAVEVKEPDPTKPAMLASIAGMVMEGPRPQESLDVELRDNKDKTKVKATVKTDKEGKYLFKDLPGGSYTVSCKKGGAAMTGGAADVELKDNEQKTMVDLKLYR